jgi:hypothetical protein
MPALRTRAGALAPSGRPAALFQTVMPALLISVAASVTLAGLMALAPAIVEAGAGLPGSPLDRPVSTSAGDALSGLLAAEADSAGAARAEPAGAAEEGRRGVAVAALRSAAVPGWGQWEQGRRGLGLGFMALETGLVATLAVSIGQGHLRRGNSEDVAERFAGMDLGAHDDRFRRLVSDFRSSDEYNLFVVYREAANLYYGDFENYNRYIEEHSLKGVDAWSWESDESWSRYRQLRRSSERAFQRARFAVAGMVVNRVASAIVAAALHRRSGGAAVSDPAGGVSLAGVEWTVHPTQEPGFEHRLAWVHRF